MAANPVEAVPDGVPPAHSRAGTGRVRRPADLLLAVFAFVIVAVVLGTIRALPLGSTEAADDVRDPETGVSVGKRERAEAEVAGHAPGASDEAKLSARMAAASSGSRGRVM